MDLTRLSQTLQTRLEGSRFSFVNTRILLRTGVNLREPRGDQANDPEVLGRVQAELAQMGIDIETEVQS